MQMTTRNSTGSGRSREVTGRTVLICLVAFFAVVGGVNAVMIGAAVSTFGGVETDSAYRAGLAFAKETAAAQAQDSLHWDVKATLLPDGDGVTRLEVIARDAAGQRLRGLQAVARLAHPADRRADRDIPLIEDYAGTFGGTVEVAAGQWDLVIELTRDGEPVFRSRNRVRVQ
jgi:nitrogen fixation protein FixH